MTTQSRGHPTHYTPEFGKLICDRIATNPVSYKMICELYPDMPHHSTILLWRRTHTDFSEMYDSAKAFQSQILVEDIDNLIPIEIQYYIDDKGQERIDPPSASLVIAKIHNRKWMAARLAPKIFGDKLQPEVASTDNLKDVSDKLDKLMAAKQKEY